LKCCLNYELDTYMDALKGIPDNVNVLKTEKGDARLQKTDIFKKLMWFSYPMDDTWIPLEIDRVKEIQKQNKEGILPADLGEIKETKRKIRTAISSKATGRKLPRQGQRRGWRSRHKVKYRQIIIRMPIKTGATAVSGRIRINQTVAIRIQVMKAVHKVFFTALTALLLLFAAGCTDPNSVIDQNTTIENHNWSYANRVKYAVRIGDAAISYNIYINLRVTDSYRYSNIFFLLRRNGPKLNAITRFEVKLANPDGEWLGQGSGGLYSYQVPLITNFKFPKKGVYHFEIEQDMRDNPLHEVSDVGLRVEKSK
jgi:gliding motility-associated lipoprotein GldH